MKNLNIIHFLQNELNKKDKSNKNNEILDNNKILELLHNWNLLLIKNKLKNTFNWESDWNIYFSHTDYLQSESPICHSADITLFNCFQVIEDLNVGVMDETFFNNEIIIEKVIKIPLIISKTLKLINHIK